MTTITNSAFYADPAYPQGTMFSDGVRIGPLTSGTITQTNGTQLPFSYKQWGQGLMTAPLASYNIIPRGPAVDNNIVNAFSLNGFGPGYLTFTADNYIVTAANAGQNFNMGNGTQYLQLDWPRTLCVTPSNNLQQATNLTIFGYDFYGMPMQETRSIPQAATQTNFNKAFYQVTGVYFNGANNTNITISIGASYYSGIYEARLGLPYALISSGHIFGVSWGNAADAGDVPILADGTNPATATSGDVRGAYVPGTAPDGVKELVIFQYVRGFDNNINLQAYNNLPAGGTNVAPLTRASLTAANQYGVPQYYTGIPG